MNSVFIPNESLEHLKCYLCKNILSFFPIYFNEQDQSICGRCLIPENAGIFIRNKPYESAIKSLQFPCCNNSNGCLEYFLPEDIPQHERFCLFRKIACPNGNSFNCSWNGLVPDLYQHYEDKHPTFILKDAKFEIDFVNKYEDNYLFFFGDELFVVKMKCNSKESSFFCSVYYLGISSMAAIFKYHLILENGNKTSAKTFPTKQTIPFGLDKDNSTEIIADEARKALNDPISIIANIEITENKENLLDDDKKSNKPNINLDMLSELECPVCFHYMIPPIYQCTAGHSLCNSCVKLEKVCPTCKKEIKNTRNYSLEKMTNFIQYPCKYMDLGCSFATKANAIKKHEEFCIFSSYECPLKDYVTCNWSGCVQDIVRHVKDLHHDNYLELDKVCVPITNDYYTTEDCDCFVLKFGLDLFKLHYKYKENMFYWAMQFIGHPENCKNFMFEIDVIDNNDNNLRTYFKTYCSALTNKTECFQEESQFVAINRKQIKSFIGDNLIYRTRIMRN